MKHRPKIVNQMTSSNIQSQQQLKKINLGQSLNKLQRDNSLIDEFTDMKSHEQDLFLGLEAKKKFGFLAKPLKLADFKVPEHHVSLENKKLFGELRKRYHKIDDEFLSLFEKRYIIFIEDGTDLMGELANSEKGNPFDSDIASQLKKRSNYT